MASFGETPGASALILSTWVRASNDCNVFRDDASAFAAAKMLDAFRTSGRVMQGLNGADDNDQHFAFQD